jgi:hypothetical protein
MLLFTAKTRGLIDRAVGQLANAQQQRIWNEWAREHPALRVPKGPVDDGGPPPRDVVLVALAALELMEAAKLRRLREADHLSEDEVSDLENDLTYISALSQQLHEMPAR